MAFSFTKFLKGITILPTSSSNASVAGDMEVVTVGGIPRVQYHNGSTVSPVVTLTSADQGAQRLQNKDIDASSGNVVDASDTTKKVGWSVSGATTGTKTTLTFTQTVNRTLTLPDATDTLVGKATTDTLTNKTLTSPTINGGTITSATVTTPTLNGSGGQLTLPAGPDTLVGRATTDTLTNKTLTSPTITTPTLSGSGGTLTLPAGPDTLVGRATTDTLTNKTIAAASNTISGLTNSNLSGSAGITYANLSVGSSIKAGDINAESSTNGQVLTSNGSGAASWVTPSAAFARNFLINANMGIHQRGASTTSLTNGNAVYILDRFYVTNSLGSGGIISYAATTPTLDQSLGAAQVLVNTAPATGVNYGINFAQSLDNPTSMQLHNQTASFSAQVKAANHINQVTLAIGYVTSEAKHGISLGLPTTIIASQTATVNSSTFTLCKLENVSMGTAVGTSGSYFVVIYASGQSGGTNISDNGNGFYVEQPMLNLGATAASFSPAGANAQAELAMCQRFYETSYNIGTALGTPNALGMVDFVTRASDTSERVTVCFEVQKRIAPTVTIYNEATGTTGTFRDVTASTNPGGAATNIGFGRFTAYPTTALTANHEQQFHWTADAEI